MRERENPEFMLYIPMILISSGLAWEDERVFFKARSNGGETLLLLHQETNPGAASFGIEGRLNLRIQGQYMIKMIFEDMDTLCSITDSSTWKYRTFESRSSKQFLSPQKVQFTGSGAASGSVR